LLTSEGGEDADANHFGVGKTRDSNECVRLKKRKTTPGRYVIITTIKRV
jgi:hypothetical protein